MYDAATMYCYVFNDNSNNVIL